MNAVQAKQVPLVSQSKTSEFVSYNTRTSVLEGKAMVVAMSRDICVSLFDEIIKLRPEWAGTKLTKDGKETGWNSEDGTMRIVMT